MKKFLAVASLLAIMTTPAAHAATMGEVNVPVLNVRAGAAATTELVGKLAEGTNVQVDEKTASNWCKITFKSKPAFVACQYLTLGATPAVTAPVTPTTPAPVVNETPAPTTSATGTGATVAPAAGFPLVRVVTVPTLNVRSAAAIADDNVIGKLALGTRVSVLEKNATNWCRIDFSGKTAWISCLYLAKAEDMPAAPVNPAPTAPTTSGTDTPTTATGATLPSAPGCTWTTKDFSGVLSMEIQQCQTGGFTFGVKGNAVYKYTGELNTADLNPVLELYAKGEDEPVMDAIMSLVAATVPADEQGKCLVQKAPYSLLDAKKELYVLAPTAEYQKAVDDRRANESNVKACGDYGQHDAAQYFEYHPEQSKTIFAFVRAGEHGKEFDQNSIAIK